MKVAASGRMVDLNGRKLHVNLQGTGNPLVVLEAGIAASSISWCLVQKGIAELTRVASYDRAGFGWSDAPTHAGTALDAAQDLAQALDQLQLSNEPLVFVGHSFGGLIVRVFQQLYPERVAGMVLVDPLIRAEWRDMTELTRRMLNRGAMLSRRGALLARMGVVRFALKLLTSGSHRLPKLMARISAGNGAGVANRLTGEVAKMPRELWPAIAAHWSEARSFTAMAGNLENLPLSVTQLDESRALGDLPLIVLSARKPNPEHAHDASLSTQGEHVTIENSGHWMQLDAPDAVIHAVGRVVARVRAQCLQ